MQTTWLPTNDYYHQIIATADAAQRQSLYLENFVQPWETMLQQFGAMNGAADDDPLAGAKAWHWLLPDDLTSTPDSLAALETANAWEIGADALARSAAQFADHAAKVGVDAVEGWLILGDPAQSPAEGRGYTGGVDWFAPRFITQYFEANEYTIPRLAGATAHEFHHLMRLRVFPWDMNTTVADYIVHEGMAESFAQALFGEDIIGFYVTDISDDDLQMAKSMIGAGLEKTGFNVVRNYIFGDHIMGGDLGMPDYGGYAVGYHVVQAYLQRTKTNIVDATFIPAQEIVRESGYFD